jgi:hypothetical protein
MTLKQTTDGLKSSEVWRWGKPFFYFQVKAQVTAKPATGF